MLFLLGCKEHLKDSGLEAPGWELGESQACEANAPPQWEQIPVAEIWAAPTEEYYHGTEPGGITVIQDDIWFIRFDGSLGVLTAESGYQQVENPTSFAGHYGFVVGDFDQSGVEDVLFPGSGAMLWDGEEWTRFWEETDRFMVDAASVDVDGDGDQDLLAGWRTPDPEAGNLRQPLLFINEGHRVFSTVPVEGADSWGVAFELSSMDANGDTTPDVYICNDMGTFYEDNVLLLNRGNQLQVAPDPFGLGLGISCMGTTWGDIDTDGRIDLIIADLYWYWVMKNTETGFVDISATMGLPTWVEQNKMAWGVLVQDVEDDGQVELLAGVSWFYATNALPGSSSIYALQKSGLWTDIGTQFGFSEPSQSRTPLTVDLNHDGTLDILFSDALTSPHIALSTGCNPNHWVEISAPEGTQVTVEAGDFTRTALVTHDRSYASAGPAIARIGLGEHSTITAITLQVPHQPPQRTEYPFPTRARHAWNPDR